jgi:uncharacterized membrane protein
MTTRTISLARVLAAVAAAVALAAIAAIPAAAGTTAREDSPSRASTARPDDPTKLTGFLRERNGRITLFEVPGAKVGTTATNVNDRGQIVGAWADSGVGDRYHGYVRNRAGDFVTLDFPGAGFTEPAGINNRGQVVGDYGDDDTDPQGERNTFLWQKGRFERIEIPGSVANGALDINDKGEIVGVNFESDESIRGFLLSKKGDLTPIEPPGAVVTYASGINNRGTIVGPYLDAAGTIHGYVRTPDGEYRTIDYPGAKASGITRINDRGEMLGAYSDIGTAPDGSLVEPRAFVLRRGVYREIDLPDFGLAYDLNDRGQIVGFVDPPVSQGSAQQSAGLDGGLQMLP